MGRSVSSSSEPRRHVKKFTSSNASYAIPAWAQNGGAIMYVTGVAPGGASSGGNTASSHLGSGGGAGAHAMRHPILVPSGTTTMAVTIGAAAAAPAVNTNGDSGGNVSIALGGVVVLQLGGGAGGSYTNNLFGGNGGLPSLFGGAAQLALLSPTAQTLNAAEPELANAGSTGTLAKGNTGVWGSSTAPKLTASDEVAWTPFGGGLASSPGGFGYGGGRAASSSSPGRAGGPGFLYVEIVEGLA